MPTNLTALRSALPGIHRYLQAGPVNACWLTPRAPDRLWRGYVQAFPLQGGVFADGQSAITGGG